MTPQQHSALSPAGVEAARIQEHMLVLFGAAALVCLLVIAAALMAARRRRDGAENPNDPRRERAAQRAVIVATGITVIALFAILTYDLAVGRDLHSPHQPHDRDALPVLLTGHQWWWEVEYEDSIPQRRVKTANELHVPVGRPVLLKLVSPDVIHSFWAPSLGGKRDMIPGRYNEMTFTATTPGRYRAQCAEYCGLQHARMGMDVIVETEEEFAAWLEAQRRPAPAPTDSVALRGRALVERGTCASCHNLTGTLANGSAGPDLTHVASRPTIAAATLPNDSTSLARWIRNPQHIKAGVLMPAHAMPDADLAAIVSYLRTLR